jgi:hypothetical protein
MERLCTKPKHVLSQMLRLMILRRHYSTDCSDYQAMRKQFPDVFFSLDLQYGNTRCIVPVYDVLVNMKINCEDQDYCTLLAKELLGRRLTIEAKRVLACAICFFGSRSFLQDMSVKLQSRAGLIKCTQVNCAVKKLLSAGLPHQLFTASFRPNLIARRAILKMKRLHSTLRARRCALTSWTRFLDRVPRLRFKEGRWARSKREVFTTLGRSLGAFRSKNLWQLLRLAFPDGACFKRSCRREVKRYTETGPGARRR